MVVSHYPLERECLGSTLACHVRLADSGQGHAARRVCFLCRHFGGGNTREAPEQHQPSLCAQERFAVRLGGGGSHMGSLEEQCRGPV